MRLGSWSPVVGQQRESEEQDREEVEKGWTVGTKTSRLSTMLLLLKYPASLLSSRFVRICPCLPFPVCPSGSCVVPCRSACLSRFVLLSLLPGLSPSHALYPSVVPACPGLSCFLPVYADAPCPASPGLSRCCFLSSLLFASPG